MQAGKKRNVRREQASVWPEVRKQPFNSVTAKHEPPKGEQMKLGRSVGKLTLALAVLLMAALSAVAQNARTLKLPFSGSLNGKQLAAGEYKVTWETHSPEATVNFMQKKAVVATVEGKWVERDTKYEANAVVYSTNPDGSRTILEVRFAGLKGALVFGEESPH
jgi:hypothetical protein